jgi:gamma-glutamyltranspeptidase/glutathione hydrolase
MPIQEAIPGGKSVGVPGNIRMMAMAHRERSKLPWATLFQPAIRLARDGFKITPRLFESLGRYKETGAMSAEGRALFYGADGNPLPVGTLVRNPAFAAFLDGVAARGPDSFYVGPNANAIVAAVNGSARNPSQMTAGDIASYDAKPRPPVCGDYRGYRICGIGPVSSVGTSVFAMLMLLVLFDLARRSALISPTTTIADAQAGTPAGATINCTPVPQTERGTSHFAAVDRWGNVASETSTIESAFGSGLMVNGYYLNNELTDFSFEPQKDGCPVANRVEGGKRPRSSMSPTIVYGPDGKVVLAVGAAGGSTIPAQVIKTIVGVLDFHLSAQDALALPMIFAPGDTVFVESGTFLEPMIPQLQSLGHASVRTLPSTTFKANAIQRVGAGWAGAADPRSEGAAASE